MKVGFDQEKYLKLQSEKILERVKQFDNKLYIEFGGKLFDEHHGSRVLPGLTPDVKIKMLEKIKDKVEILFCVSANDIESNRVRGDSGLTYDMEALRLIDSLRNVGLLVNNILITLFKGQQSVLNFATKLKNKGENVYFHGYTKGYPTDVETIVSDEGYGANPYIPTTRPIVVVTAPGAKSGKLATCLSQLYHEHKKGIKAGYTKFETFPIWNLPLKHPVNVAYEAATADLKDVNMIDPYYYNACEKIAINYNRDIEVFPILNRILTQITGEEGFYNSPTDMGVNMAGFGICDDEACKDAAKQEVIRRFYRYQVEYKKGLEKAETVERVQLLMNDLGIKKEDRVVVGAALEKSEKTGRHATAILLDDGKIITAKEQDIFTSSAGCVLNALKYMAGIDDAENLIPAETLEMLLGLKKNVLHMENAILSLKDVLTILSLNQKTDERAKKCLEQVHRLKGCDVHTTCILRESDENNWRNLGVLSTCEPVFSSNRLFDF